MSTVLRAFARCDQKMQQPTRTVQCCGEHLPGNLSFRRTTRSSLGLVIEIIPERNVCCQASVVDERKVVKVPSTGVSAGIDVAPPYSPAAVSERGIKVEAEDIWVDIGYKCINTAIPIFAEQQILRRHALDASSIELTV